MPILTVALSLDRPTVGTEFVYVLSDDGTHEKAHGTAPLALLPAADTVVLVVPAAMLSWQEVRLPPVAASRLRQALDGMLEERLLDEPAQLAFALAPQRGADGSTLVAVCDRPWLRAALALFEQAQRPARRVVPEFAPPHGDAEPPRLMVTGTALEPVLVMLHRHGVVRAPLQAASMWLGPDVPGFEDVAVQADPEVAELAEQVLGRTVDIQPVPQRLLASTQTAWELAQFELANSHGGRLARRGAMAWQRFTAAPAWRPARWGLVAVLLANLAGLNAWAWHQQRTLENKRAQIRGVLTQTFPRVRTVLDAPAQMERELAVLRQSSGALSPRDMEVMLAAIGSALPAGKNPSALSFAPGETSARGLGLGASDAGRVLEKLAGMGYTARLDGDQLVVRMGTRP